MLRSWFFRFGIPKQIVTDNGPQFTSKQFKEFITMNGINHVTSPVYHQQSNGAAERCVQTLKKALESNNVDSLNIERKLQDFLQAYHATPSAKTGKTPSELFIGRRIRTKLDLLRPENLRVKCSLTEKRRFSNGERVFVKNFRGRSKWLSGKIIRQISPTCYVILINGRMVKRHIDHMTYDKTVRDTHVRDHTEDEYWSIHDSPHTSEAVPANSETRPQVADDTSITIERYPLRERHAVDRYGMVPYY